MTAKHLQPADGETRYRAAVVSSERITSEASDDEVREIELEVDSPGLDLRIGQSIGVLAPGGAPHFRLYSVADLPVATGRGRSRIKICVRRCNYLDPYDGEERRGVASNYLCDLRPGDTLTITGPYGLAFELPEAMDANVILIGTGTGIAPFRAFVKHVYGSVPEWRGRIWLFYGARSGLELLYMNDKKDDFAQYCDEETFEAFRALSARPCWTDPIAWDEAIAERAAELWKMLADPRTYVYVAGLEPMRDELDGVFSRLAGSTDRWRERKAALAAGGRWVELLY